MTFTDGRRGGLLGQGERADGDVLSGSHGAGCPRLLGAREPARHAAAAAAAERARISRPRPTTGGRCRCGADGDASPEPRVRGVPRADGSARASRWRTSTRSAAGARSAAACRWTRPRCSRTARRSTASPGLRALRPAAPRTDYVHTFVVEAADLRARPPRRLSRPAGASARIVRDAAAGGYRWSALILGIVTQHAVPDGEGRLMMITRKALSRRTMLRVARRCDSAAVPRRDGAGARRRCSRRRRSRALRFGAVYVPNGVIPGQWFPTAEGSGVRVLADARSRWSGSAIACWW